MELEQIDVIGTEAPQALLNVGLDGLFILSSAFGGDDHPIPDARQGLTQFFLAVRIHIGSVKVIDASVNCPTEQPHRICLWNPLNGQSSKSGLGNVQLCTAQPDSFHIGLPSPPLRRQCNLHIGYSITLFRLCKSSPVC